MAELKFAITGENTDLMRKMEQVMRSMESTKTQADATNYALKDMLKQTAALAGVSLGAAGLKEFVSSMVNVRKEIQGFQTSFNVLLGDADKASAMFGELKQFAVTTPLMLKDLAGGAQTMLGFNIEAEKVVPTLKEIGDISMGDSQKFNSLVLAFSQMSATGKLMGQDLLQMINAGFNPLAEMSRKTGKSIKDLKEEMSNGAISAEMVADAFKSATSEGGQFFGMMEAQGKTIAGSINTLQGAIDDMFNSLATDAEPIITGSISALTKLAQNYDTVGRAIASCIATYGAYKAALIATTVVENIHIAGLKDGLYYTLLNTSATKAATAAQAAFNAVMKMNPYVLAATALVAVAGAMWAFHDSETAAEAGTKAYNERLKERAELEQKTKEETEKALSALQDETAGEYERQQALDSLKQKYPGIFKQYDIESIKLANILDLKKQIAAIDYQQGAENIRNDIKDIDKQIAQYGMSNGNSKKIERLVGERKQAQRELSKYIGEEYTNGLQNADEATLKKYVSVLEQRIKGKKDTDEINLRLPGADGKLGDEGIFSVKDVGSLIELTNKKINPDKETTQDNKKYWEGKKKEAQAKLDALDHIAAAGKEGDKLRAEIAKYNQMLEPYNATKTASQDAKDAKSGTALADEQRKQADEQIKAEIQKERESAQAVIDAMADGNEKKRKQIDLNFRKEEDQINEWYQGLKDTEVANERELWEKANPKGNWSNEQQAAAEGRAKEAVDSEYGALYVSKMDAANVKKNQDLKKVDNDERQHMIDYLKDYGDMQQQRLAIAMDYDEKIKNAGDEWERKSLQSQKEISLKQFDSNSKMKALKSNPDYVEAMIDPSRLSAGSLGSLKDQLNDMREELATLPPDQLEAITGLMQQIDDAIIAQDPFGKLKESLDELDTAKLETAAAKANMIAANNDVKKLKESKAPTEQIAAAEKKAAEATNAFTNALNNQQRAQNNVNKSSAKTSDIVGEIGRTISQVGNTVSEFNGKVGSFISGMGSLVSSVGTAMKTTSEETTGALHAIESASAILAIISAAIQLAQSAADLLGLTKDDSSYNRAKQEYQTLTSVWDDLLEKKREYLEMSWGSEIQATGDEAKAIARNSISAARQLAKERLSAGSSIGSHSYGVRMNQDLSGYFGQVGISDISQLADLSGDRLEQIKEKYAVFWAKLDDDYRDYLQDIIDGTDTIEDLEDSIKEQFTQMTFDGMYDSFVDTLMDMDSSAADFADDVSEYFMKAILSNQIGTKYKERLEAWYDEMAADLQANGGTLTEDDTARLQQEYQDIVNEAIDLRDQIADATGYTGSGTSGSSGVSASVTQDSIDEANGRMSALQMGQQTIINQGIQLVSGQQQTNTTLNDILTGNALRNSMLSDMYERMGKMQTAMGDYLQQIYENTKNI